MARQPKKPPPLKYPVAPLQESHWVDELDLEEVLQHVDPNHQAPTKN
jgi:hypothetical protein